MGLSLTGGNCLETEKVEGNNIDPVPPVRIVAFIIFFYKNTNSFNEKNYNFIECLC